MNKGMGMSAVLATLAGLAGAAVWAAIIYYTHYELGLIAWGIGALVGAAAFAGAGGYAGTSTGAMAAVVTILSIVGGKYAGAHFMVNEFLPATPDAFEVTEEDMLVSYADDVVEEWESQGRQLTWPEGMSVDEATEEKDYPPTVWAEAEKRWAMVDEADRTAAMQAKQAEWQAGLAQVKDSIRLDAFKESFGVLDIVFFLFAIATAYGIGKGGSDA